MNNEQLKELFSDEAFVTSILELETVEEVQKALADKGLELSIDEIITIKNTLANEETELSEDDLENVAGGGLFEIFFQKINLTPENLAPGLPRNLTTRRW